MNRKGSGSGSKGSHKSERSVQPSRKVVPGGKQHVPKLSLGKRRLGSRDRGTGTGWEQQGQAILYRDSLWCFSRALH